MIRDVYSQPLHLTQTILKCSYALDRYRHATRTDEMSVRRPSATIEGPAAGSYAMHLKLEVLTESSSGQWEASPLQKAHRH